MEINLKKIFASIGFLVSLIGSIPIAMSAPDSNIYTDRIERVNPAIFRPVIVDGNPNGAQVRVTFELLPGEQFSCKETQFKVIIVGDLRSSSGFLVPQVNDPNSYNILRSSLSKRGQGFAGNAGNNCLYNFNLEQDYIGKKAFVSVSSPVLPSRDNNFSGSLESPVAIKNLRQTFNLKVISFRRPN